MAEIENIHCPICTQPIPSSWQNGLPPALATDERQGVEGNKKYLSQASDICLAVPSFMLFALFLQISFLSRERREEAHEENLASHPSKYYCLLMNEWMEGWLWQLNKQQIVRHKDL